MGILRPHACEIHPKSHCCQTDRRAWSLTIPHCVGSCRKLPKSSPQVVVARFISICLFGQGIPSVATKAFSRNHSLPLAILLTWVERFTLRIRFSAGAKCSLTAVCLVFFLLSGVKPDGWADAKHLLNADEPRTHRPQDSG